MIWATGNVPVRILDTSAALGSSYHCFHPRFKYFSLSLMLKISESCVNLGKNIDHLIPLCFECKKKQQLYNIERTKENNTTESK